MKRSIGYVFLLAVLLIAGCSGPQDETIKKGDRLKITAAGTPNDVTVQEDGSVELGPLGKFDVAGKRFSEVSTEITAKIQEMPMPDYSLRFFGVEDRPADSAYDRLQSGDVALVTVGGVETEAEVSPSGEIKIPVAGNIQVARMTFADAATKILDALPKPKEGEKPEVSVRLAGIAPRVPGYSTKRFVAKDKVVLQVGDKTSIIEVKPSTGMIPVPVVSATFELRDIRRSKLSDFIQQAWRRRKVGTFVEKVDVLRKGDPVIVNFDNTVSDLTVAQDGKLTVPGVDPVDAHMKTTDEIIGELSEAWGKKQVMPTFALQADLDKNGKIKRDSDVQYTVDGETFTVPLADDSKGGYYNGFHKVGEVRIAEMTIPDALKELRGAWTAQLSVHVFVQKPSKWILHGTPFWLAVSGILAAFFIAFYALTRVNNRFRRWVVASFVFVCGAFWVFEFFLPTAQDGPNQGQNFLTPYITSVAAPASNVISGILLGLGVVSLLRVHGTRVTRKQKDWSFSLILLLMIPLIATILLVYFGPDNPYVLKPIWHSAQNLVFQQTYANMDAAMFSMIAFFIMSAAYRAFRLRSVEASILMITALIVLLGLLPIGALITKALPTTGLASSLRIENIAQWVLQTINSPALRAIEFGIGVGVLAMSIRIWLNLERGALFD